MMPRMLTTHLSSARNWEGRFEHQQAIADWQVGRSCHQTMQRLADTSRREANREWHLASNESHRDDSYLRGLFWILRLKEGQEFAMRDVQKWTEIRMLANMIKKSPQEVATDFIEHARLLGE